MTLIYRDRVLETSVTAGLGDMALQGASTEGAGFQDFLSTVGLGNTCFYLIEDTNNKQWETGLGTIVAGPILERTDPRDGSSGPITKVAFGAGEKNIALSNTGKSIDDLIAAVALNTTHRGLTSNPHSVTAAQVGADPVGTAAAAVGSHESAYNHALLHSNALDHTQGTDQGLDTGGPSAVTAAQTKTAFTHSQLTGSNPHAVTKANVGLASVTNDAQLKRAAGDFSSFGVKGTPIGADVILIEDSAAGGAKKHILISTLPSAGGTVQAAGPGLAIQATDEGLVGGNARGLHSTDLQTVRSAADRVASGLGATISGGQSNRAGGADSTVSGGRNNRTTEASVAMVGGLDNRSYAAYTFMGGGYDNYIRAVAIGAVVCGGVQHDIYGGGDYGFIGGGRNQRISGSYGTAPGGKNNYVKADYATVSGGYQSYAGSVCATVGGGVANNTNGATVNQTFGTITGTVTERLAGKFSTVGGGQNNDAPGDNATIAGGRENTASGYASVIGGGFLNTSSNNISVVCGGGGSFYGGNTASGYAAAVVGGGGNLASGGTSFIGGGKYNIAGTNLAVVVGGQSNRNYGQSAVIGGGHSSYIDSSRSYAVISGGRDNSIISSGNYQTIGGGRYNIASSNFSTIGGGQSNTASGYYSFIGGGRQAVADKFGQQSHAAGRLLADGDAQTSQFVLRRQTTDATANVELFLDGSSARMTITSDTSWAFQVLVIARRTDADNESAIYSFEGGIDNNAGTTASLTINKTVVHEDSAAWDCNVTADNANDSLKIDVTGEAAKTINWVVFVRTVEVTG